MSNIACDSCRFEPRSRTNRSEAFSPISNPPFRNPPFKNSPISNPPFSNLFHLDNLRYLCEFLFSPFTIQKSTIQKSTIQQSTIQKSRSLLRAYPTQSISISNSGKSPSGVGNGSGLSIGSSGSSLL